MQQQQINGFHENLEELPSSIEAPTGRLVERATVPVEAKPLIVSHAPLEPTSVEPEPIDVLEEISKFVFTSKYARYSPENQRRETWDEAIDRIETMHLKKFRGKLTRQQRDKIRWAVSLIRTKRIIPAMRTFQFSGKAIEVVNARNYNCSVRHLDSIRAFSEIFYLLLCGCGVGIGLTGKYLSRLPNLVAARDKTGTVLTYVIDDSIEGWADSLEVLLLCYTKGNPFSGRKVIFDYSKIRPVGALLKTGGGRAPGYGPLKAAHQRIKTLFDTLIEENRQERLRSVDAYDILMHTADAVISGGVRRSATSVIFDKDDEDMLAAKTGEWWGENPQRGRSNNSVLLLRNNISLLEFKSIIERTKEWGEPGFVFADHEDTVYNPCFEIGFIPVTKDGVCGVQFCNLTSINGALIQTEQDLLECAEAASIIGTLQASYTDFPYLSNAAQELTEDEALLGVSITGMLMNQRIIMDPVVQRRAATKAVSVNKEWASILGINQAARVTCVKPEGSGSLALGLMANGIHPAHDHYMFRRIQANKLDPVYKHFKSINPHLCDESVYSINGTDDVVTFPIRVPDDTLVKKDLDALTHLGIVKSTQENWVIPGTVSLQKPVYHNVSCTVQVKQQEWDSVSDFLFFNRQFFSAVSLLPSNGDKMYKQAPNESVTTEEDFNHYHNDLCKMKPVDYTQMVESQDNTEHTQEISCGGIGGTCDLV